MDEQLARSLIARYVEGWKCNDAKQILETLTPDCLIIESHGPMYRGRDHVQQWISDWYNKGGSIQRWDITSILYTGASAAFEWVFEYSGSRGQSVFEGATVVRFSGNQIGYMREYRCTKPPYLWDAGT